MTNQTTIAHIKRLVELLEGDPDFAREAQETPSARQRLLDDAGICLAAEDLSPFWSLLDLKGVTRDHADRAMERFEGHELWDLWGDWCRALSTKHQQEVESWIPAGDRRVRAWRARQLARVQSDVLLEGVLTVSPLFSFELSSGCSAQCWFCGLAPGPLRGWFAGTEPHRQLWREVLAASWELFGVGCRGTALYHASEPTDNPDYLHFIRDFYEICGVYPQTTTARPLKNLVWTRELMSLRAHDPSSVDRFSVLNRHALRKIHQAFTPEELLNVSLVLQSEGVSNKALCGRAIDQSQTHASGCLSEVPSEQSDASLMQMTIECCCGFLVNMVDWSIRLISPCNASPRWPLGYEVHAEGTFRDAAEFRAFILQSIEDCMPAHVGPDNRLAFRTGLQYEPHDDGFSLVSRYRRHDLRGNPRLVLLGDLVRQGESTTGDVTDQLVGSGMPVFAALSWLDRLYQAGLLEESAPGGEPSRHG